MLKPHAALKQGCGGTGKYPCRSGQEAAEADRCSKCLASGSKQLTKQGTSSKQAEGNTHGGWQGRLLPRCRAR